MYHAYIISGEVMKVGIFSHELRREIPKKEALYGI